MSGTDNMERTSHWISFLLSFLIYPILCASQSVDNGTIRVININGSSWQAEVLQNQTWVGICSDAWGQEEANVLCRQVGLSSPSLMRVESSEFTVGLFDLQCNGNETSLSECSIGEDIGPCPRNTSQLVICEQEAEPENGTIRLVDGAPNAGRVEIYLNGEWGTVCDDLWGFQEARVVCRQLGFASALGAFGVAYFNPGVGTIHLDDLQCQGDEVALADCAQNNLHNCDHFEDAGVVCSDYEHILLRLIGSNETSGQVELNVDGEWVEICGDGLGQREADVICRQLGLKGAINGDSSSEVATNGTDGLMAETGNGTGTRYNVTCHGNESAVGRCRVDQVESCQGKAEIVCIPPEDGSVRLVDGPSASVGRVEIYLEGQWGTICDNQWHIAAAEVVCAQLGSRGAISAPKYSHFGGGMGAIHLTSAICEGTESSLLDCRLSTDDNFSYFSQQDVICDHTEDAGVVCVSEDDGAIRLIDGDSDNLGRVEIFLRGLWGTVCDDQWGIEDAIVVCRQLGYVGAWSALGRAHFGAGTGIIHLDNTGCLGNEESLLDCSFWNTHDCIHTEDAGVICVGQDEGQLRLVDGIDPYSGRVEIFINGSWGRVCAKGWDHADAEVVCRQLGLGKAIQHAGHSLSFGSGRGDFLLGGVECNGTESHLAACPSAVESCRDNRDATAVCEPSSFGTESPIRLIDDSTNFTGVVEVLFGGRWGAICDVDWDLNDSMVVCRQLGYGDAIEVNTSRKVSTREDVPILLSNFRCYGNETNLAECDFSFGAQISNDSCRRENVVEVICAKACLRSIRCPDDISVELDPGTDRLNVSWTVVQIPKNPCGTVSHVSSHTPGESFQEGLTTVIYNFTDESGASKDCTFTINVTREQNVTDIPIAEENASPLVVVSVVLIATVCSIILIGACLWWSGAPCCKRCRRRPLPMTPAILVSNVNPAYQHSSEDGFKDHEEGIYDAIPGCSDPENPYYITPVGRKASNDTAETISLSSLSSPDRNQWREASLVTHVRIPGAEGLGRCDQGGGTPFVLSEGEGVETYLPMKGTGDIQGTDMTGNSHKRLSQNVPRYHLDMPKLRASDTYFGRDGAEILGGTDSEESDPYCIYSSRIGDSDEQRDRINDSTEEEKGKTRIPGIVDEDRSRSSNTSGLYPRDSNKAPVNENIYILDIGNF